MYIKKGVKNPFFKIRKSYCLIPDVASEFDTSLDTFFRIVQLPLYVSNVNAAHELLDSHKDWQASKFLNFFEVFTEAILPLRDMFSFFSKTISAVYAGIATIIAPRIISLDIFFIFIPYIGG